MENYLLFGQMKWKHSGTQCYCIASALNNVLSGIKMRKKQSCSLLANSNLKFEIIFSVSAGCVSLLRQPIIPTAHYFDDPLFRQPIIPTAHYSDGPFFRQCKIELKPQIQGLTRCIQQDGPSVRLILTTMAQTECSGKEKELLSQAVHPRSRQL